MSVAYGLSSFTFIVTMWQTSTIEMHMQWWLLFRKSYLFLSQNSFPQEEPGIIRNGLVALSTGGESINVTSFQYIDSR